jgi:hypothetical protein
MTPFPAIAGVSSVHILLKNMRKINDKLLHGRRARAIQNQNEIAYYAVSFPAVTAFIAMYGNADRE